MRDAGGAELRLGLAVLLGQPHRARVHVGEAGIDDAADARPLRGLDHVAVLLGAPADVGGGDEQERVDAFEGGSERVGAGVVGLSDEDAPRPEVGGFVGAAHGSGDLGGVDAPPDQASDDEAAEVAGGSGDGDHGLGVELVDGIEGVTYRASQRKRERLGATVWAMPERGTMQGGWSTYAIYDLAELVHRGPAERDEEALAPGVDGTLRPDEPSLDRHLPALGRPHLCLDADDRTEREHLHEVRHEADGDDGVAGYPPRHAHGLVEHGRHRPSAPGPNHAFAASSPPSVV